MNEADVALNRYLQEIGSIRLLTAEREVALLRRIQKGDSTARERMIQANLRLVVVIAQDYVNLDLPLFDLMSEGNKSGASANSAALARRFSTLGFR
jgi:RNA polymerase primary sigma factor